MNCRIFVVVCYLAISPLAIANEEAIEAAKSAADAWLVLTDNLRFRNSWSNASSLFQAAVSEEAWETSLGAARKPLGKLGSRNLNTAQFSSTLPGAPDGEYVVLIFASSFQHKETAIETVTVMKDQDSSWRVSGYYIR